ncbi:uncharacterized protein LOC108908462 [Anoplophora glabripennis]|uniref:uncharacterized protein LOC108908462 n=1 Tax=Anoplophora glabripennis TaxID=217634 RepID=UPI000875994E|nr:uncharacterized protein LOC108908462 [Anoplophora glabripennis]
MKRKKSPPPTTVLCVSVALVLYACGRASGSPAQHAAVGKFQEVVQQQNFFSVLTSIEERLKNLDNIYSMQLSQTLETKLDQYSRRLEALDTKIIRLEALVMLNLDKISENISTKNFKDDMSRSNLLRKMDSVYEGINHRLGYMDRKYETNLAKIQTKVDTTLSRLEKIEENMTTRDSDIEAEISDVIFAIDDLKTTCNAMEEKIYNVTTAVLNVTQSAYKYLQDKNVDTRKAMNALHDNIIENLKFMNNKTLRHFKLVEDNNFMLKSMKTELKEDFNDYANKVADMSSYIWKNTDSTDDDLKRIETFVNNTKTEVQNGVRSLMLQIGKIPNKEIVTSPGDNSLDEINKNLKLNFQRILTNQDVFLESCHRLQMDEAQIESEISVTLESLIDMIEKKMASGEGVKNLERSLKTHDNRIIRNVHQVNTNLISLFETYTKSNAVLSTEVKKIGNGLDDLFKFVRGTLSDESPSSLSTNVKVLQRKLDKIEHTITTISGNQSHPRLRALDLEDNVKKQILQQLQKFSESLSSIESQVHFLKEENFERILDDQTYQKYFHNCSVRNVTKMNAYDETELDSGTRQAIEQIFGTKLDWADVGNKDTGKRKCNTNLQSAALEDCVDAQEKNRNPKKSNKKKKKGPITSLIDIRGNFGPEQNLEYDDSEENYESTTINTQEVSLINKTTNTTDEDLSGVKLNDTAHNI